MKFIFVVLSAILTVSAAAHAAGQMNRFECVYLKSGQSYTSLESVFDPRNYTLAPAQVYQGFAGWTNQGKTNYAICSTMTGTVSPDRVIVHITSYKGTWFNQINSCDVTGKNVQLVNSVSKEIGRGEHVDLATPFPYNAWQGLMLKVYFPTRAEIAGDLPSVADDTCGRIRP